jgi:putative flippase GtrA
LGTSLAQFARFGLVGGLNTLIDLVILNGLLWLVPTRSTGLLLIFNSIAYSVGAINSFLLNKYWTFRVTGRAQPKEVGRFALTTLAGMACNTLILWVMSSLLHPVLLSAVLWANASKLVAIGGTVLISYLGMRLWVFVHPVQETHPLAAPLSLAAQRRASPVVGGALPAPASRETGGMPSWLASSSAPASSGWLLNASLSVVLPIYNEAAVIQATVERVVRVLDGWVRDFEVILVNDGSTDETGTILAAIAAREPRVRLVTHARNQGYGAALVDGFAAASKELLLFMDSDGQFDIRDLARLAPFIPEYDAVLGYRLKRQDTWMRKLNAWGWKLLIGLVLGVRVRDIDCAFKLLRTDFLRQHPLETRGAMINAELLYKLRRAGCTWREVGVFHYPRLGGRATGAKLRVILRAFRELFFYARRWRCEDQTLTAEGRIWS